VRVLFDFGIQSMVKFPVGQSQFCDFLLLLIAKTDFTSAPKVSFEVFLVESLMGT
jgi:hypothetical protein